ncbi:MAG: hypothetical protein ACJ0G4_00030 [Alphaproteobacteria bacterium]|tara:strand:- start:728 stop:1195 length:468 start_codon:yes stop_codon:yes gene_type:complete
MSKKLKIIILSFTIILSSCSINDIDKSSIMKTTSTAVGGYFGYELSDGDLLSTTVGSTFGAFVGTYLSDFINQDDYYFFKKESLRVLEINDNNSSIISGYWKNPKSGNNGVVKIKGYFGSPECRLIENIYLKGNQATNAYGTACREKSGQWAMIK